LTHTTEREEQSQKWSPEYRCSGERAFTEKIINGFGFAWVHVSAVVFYEELAYNSFNKERGALMPNIKPVSDLRNYNEVLRDVAVGEPVFLTKNGRGRYALVDIADYEKNRLQSN
jgi:prevent-host-death family protein